MNYFRKINFVVLITAFLLTKLEISGQGTMSKEELKKQIVSELGSIKGRFAVAFIDLNDPSDTLFINENESFHAASTMKTPVMIEIFKQAAEGKFKLTDSLLVKNEFTSIVDGSKFSLDIDRDSGDKMYSNIGKKLSIKELVYDMITVSGNLSTNTLIEIVKPKNVTETMRKLGAENINVLRGVEDIKAFEQGLSNTTTAKDLMIIFERIADYKILNEDMCRQMIDILLDQKFNSVIPANLPKDVVVAHKTGSIDGVQHDSGIVYLPGGKKYVLVLLSKDLESNVKATHVLANISKLIYDYIVEKK